MKRLFPVAFLILASLLAGAAQTVELNGLACFGGEKCAFFVIHQPGQPVSPGFMLAEGETDSGIKLLAVDALAGRVEIENQGEKQSLRLATSTGLASSALAGTGVDKSLVQETDGATSHGQKDQAARDQLAGNPGWGTLPPASGQAGSNKNSTGQGTQNANGSDPASTLKDQSDEPWYQESLVIEQNRQETVAEVLSGDMTPWPRTPLTPAGTPANLVGPETFFSNHIPHYIVPGFLNQ